MSLFTALNTSTFVDFIHKLFSFFEISFFHLELLFVGYFSIRFEVLLKLCSGDRMISFLADLLDVLILMKKVFIVNKSILYFGS